MNTFTGFLKRHSLSIGILLMFLLTWPIDLSSSGILPVKFPFVIYLFLGWGFVFASVIMTWLTLGKMGAVSLLRRYLLWHVGWKWYLAAIGLPMFMIITSVYLNAAITRIPPDFSTVMAHQIFGASANLPLFVIPFFLVEIISNGEEIGWRGYVLPRLQAKYSALTSTLILGVIWGFWHLPKYLSHWSTVSFAWFMLHTTAFAIILTWIYNNTKGSLLLAALCHSIANTTGVFFPMANTVMNGNMGAYIIYVLLEVIAAIIITFTSGARNLSRKEMRQIQE